MDQERKYKTLREMREDSRMTQMRLATTAGLSYNTVQAAEAGRKVPTARTLLRLAEALANDEHPVVELRPEDLQVAAVLLSLTREMAEIEEARMGPKV